MKSPMRKRGEPVRSPAPVTLEAAAPQKVPPSELGPAVTEDFADAVGLQDVRGSAGLGRPATAATLPGGASAPAPPAVDYAKLITNLLKLIDTATSAVLGVAPETPEDLETPATCMAPWITAHAGDMTSETGMRLLALSGLLTFVAMKVIKWSQKPKPKKPRPDVATAAEDEASDIVAAAEGRE